VLYGKLDPKTLAHVRAYMRLRPECDTDQLFVTAAWRPLSKWGGRMIWRRIQKRSGVKRLGSHLLRSFAQHMAGQGASISDIQHVLGHESDKMARHHAGDARRKQAANIMEKCSLAS
jgi:integrase